MKVEINNNFLFILGTTFGVLNLFFPNIFFSFIFGASFGQIYLNVKRRKDQK
jgi:hypothetical protein